MTATVTAVAVLALTAQIGAPVLQQEPLGRDAWVDEDPVGESVQSAGWQAGPDGGVAARRSGPVEPGVTLEGRLSPADREWVDRIAAALTLEEKVAQLVISYIEGGQPAEGSARWRRAARLVEEQKVGGFIVGVGPGHGTATWLNELQRRSTIPLLMTADLEWGPGTRLRGATELPMNMAIAAAGSPELAYDAGRITALEARASGIHMAFAPVADVNVNPDNPVINTRSYGSDPYEVSDRVVAFIEGARSAGLLTVVKHFPGHGDTETDSHLALPILDVDRIRLDDVELRPFRAAIHAGVEGVMTAHLAVPLLDPWLRPRPATLSPPILTDLLRHELGFGGLVVTDALHMDGVMDEGSAGEVAVAALLAGADLLLIPPSEVEAIDAVVSAVRSGVLTEQRIDRSLRRVLMAKAATGLHLESRTNMGMVLSQVGRADHEKWGRHVAERSITLPRIEGQALPMDVAGRTVLAIIYDDGRNHSVGGAFEQALTDRGARVITVRLSRSSGAADLARARRMASMADIALFTSFSRAVPWKGSLGLPAAVAMFARELGRAGAPVLSFGDPYLIRQLHDIGTYMLAWSRADVSQVAAVRALVGEIPVTGRLPIDLPPDYRVGDGVVVPMLPGITTISPH